MNLAFFPMHLLGLKGMPRRIADYPATSGWQLLNTISTIGAFTIAVALTIFFVNVLLTMRKPRNAPDDPWGANTLEWATSSPPPVHNFDRLPPIRSLRPVYDLREAEAGVVASAPAPGGEGA
jgi:cytochrome c oxidase subunit 1